LVGAKDETFRLHGEPSDGQRAEMQDRPEHGKVVLGVNLVLQYLDQGKIKSSAYIYLLSPSQPGLRDRRGIAAHFGNKCPPVKLDIWVFPVVIHECLHVGF
jgi:hypothetical protein